MIFAITNLAHTRYIVNRPQIIGVTGSVGKTSTREAIFSLLYSKFGNKVLQSPKNYNGDIGLPLTFLQEETGNSDIIAWIKIVIISIFKILNDIFNKFRKKGNYPEHMIVEYGVDHPGEMDIQLKVAIPDIAVVTKIAPVHTQEFINIKNIATEKSKIVKNLNKKSISILNFDDINVRNMAKSTKSKVIFFGKQTKKVHIGFSDIKETVSGIEFVVHDNMHNSKERLNVKLLGSYNAYIILPAIAIGIELGISLKEAVEILRKYKPPKGRMRMLEGVNRSIIVDGSYNASPITMSSAIQSMKIFKNMNRILYLGDMRELGPLEESEHIQISKLISKYSDYAVLVGPCMEKFTVPELLKLNYPKNKIFSTLNSAQAGKHINKIILSKKRRSVIICKGSQNTIRLERGIKYFLSHKLNPNNELARQDLRWLSE